MKYLDEKIELSVTLNQQTGVSKTLPYFLYIDGVNIFNGNCFVSSTQRTITLDVTDILRNFAFTPKNMLLPLSSETAVIEGNNYLIENVYVKISVNDTLLTSKTETVAFIYRYPNHKVLMETTLGQLFDPANETKKYVQVMLQGFDLQRGYGYRLIPHIPYKLTSNYGFGFVAEVGKMAEGLNTFLTDNDHIVWTTSLAAIVSNPVTNVFYPLRQLFQNTKYVTEQKKEWFMNGVILTGEGDWESTDNGYGAGTANEMQDGQKIFFVYDSAHPAVDVIYNGIGDYHFEQTFTKARGGDNLLIRVYYNIAVEDEDDTLTFDISQIPNGKEFTVSFDYSFPNNRYIRINMNTFSVTTIEPLPYEDTYLCYKNRNNWLAKIDILCFPKYYLLWQDRYGSYQSQPFDGVSTFRNSYNRTEISVPERRVVYNEVKPSWTIKSGWLTDEEYPYYESIFVSPYLLLYDVDNDTSYNVIVTDDYTEKTFANNNRELFNLELNLEENKNQNILH